MLSNYNNGLFAEIIAIIFLKFKNYKILKWRYKYKFAEIDIIAKKSDIICFIEVKFRKNSHIDNIVHPKQIERIQKLANLYLLNNKKYSNLDKRIDLIIISNIFSIKHYQNISL